MVCNIEAKNQRGGGFFLVYVFFGFGYWFFGFLLVVGLVIGCFWLCFFSFLLVVGLVVGLVAVWLFGRNQNQKTNGRSWFIGSLAQKIKQYPKVCLLVVYWLHVWLFGCWKPKNQSDATLVFGCNH